MYWLDMQDDYIGAHLQSTSSSSNYRKYSALINQSKLFLEFFHYQLIPIFTFSVFEIVFLTPKDS